TAALLEFAQKHANIPMPGYTHMQRAMLSSVGLWAASFAEALLDDEQLLSASYTLNDQSPLGSAAGYGVPIPIDRQYSAELLVFSTVEYGFFQVPQELCTGSSIMPQKRNLGVMELVRARTQTMLALQQQILGIVTGLPSGYNMDYQETKRPFMEALDLVQDSL